MVLEMLPDRQDEEIRLEHSIMALFYRYQRIQVGRTVASTGQGLGLDPHVFMTFADRIAAILACPFADEKLIMAALTAVDLMAKNSHTATILARNPLMQALFECRMVINLEHLPLERTGKSRTLLHTLYVSVVPHSRLIPFLTSYDQRFRELGSEASVFSLYCDLKGLFRGVCRDRSRDEEKYARILSWFSEYHFQDTINVIQRYAKSFLVVKSVCQFWTGLFPEKFASVTVPKNSGFGISLFRASLEILTTLLRGTSSDGDKCYALFKVIRYCVNTSCANFGVMALYGDNSYDDMVKLFFDLLANAVQNFAAIWGQNKIVKNALKSLSAVIKVINVQIYGNRERVLCVVQFLLNCLKEARFSAHPGDIWENTWTVVLAMLEVAANQEDSANMIRAFEPHGVVILDAAVNSRDNYAMESSVVLLYLVIYDTEFVQRIASSVCDELVGHARAQVRSAFTKLFGAIDAEINEERKKEFKRGFVAFKSMVKEYGIAFRSSSLYSQYL
jgi:hypothetical protein